MTWILAMTIAAGAEVRTLTLIGRGGDLACVTRLAAELDRAYRRGERILQAECRPT